MDNLHLDPANREAAIPPETIPDFAPGLQVSVFVADRHAYINVWYKGSETDDLWQCRTYPKTPENLRRAQSLGWTDETGNLDALIAEQAWYVERLQTRLAEAQIKLLELHEKRGTQAVAKFATEEQIP